MLHFFKKTGRTVENEEKVPDDVKGKELSSSPSSSLFDIIVDEKIIDDGKEFVESRSRLSKNLLEIISDKNCICYFVQFLETKCALSLIKFYLDAENFKTVAEFSLNNKKLKENKEKNTSKNSKILTNEDNKNNLNNEALFSDEKCDNKTILNQTDSSIKNLTKTELEKIIPKNNDDSNVGNNCENYDNVHKKITNKNVFESVPELKSLCDLSMQKSLTDDEKSRLYAKTNKKSRNQHKQKLFQDVDNELLHFKSDENSKTFDYSSTSFKFNTSVATDAFRIYKKYLTLNSQYFIDIPATITSSISLALCTQQISINQENNDKINNSNIGASNCSSLSYEDTLQSSKVYISSNCFEEAKRYVYDRMEKEYLNEFLESDFYCKYCLDILTCPDLQLSDIIYNESALFYFMEYLEQENQRNYLEFWIAAINFRKQYYKYNHNNIDSKGGDNDGDEDDDDDDDDDDNIDVDNVSITNNAKLKEARSDAMILYEKYFSLQAKNRLKITDNVRSKIEENICSNNNITISKCFDLPLKIIENHFEKNCFVNFVKSQLFTNYLNELRNRLKDTKFSNKTTRTLSLNKKHKQQQFNYRGHRKTMSDCTNENTNNVRNENFDNNSISQYNTLLAMESHRNKLRNINCKTGISTATATTMLPSSTSQSDYMQIETRYLTNPDLLWHRNLSRNNSNISSNNSNSSGLTFGRVDSFGRYERDFDLMEITEENKWSLATGGSKIKNAVRKLVNLPEEKVQEEIAWQVAELIVKDITSITLGNSYNNDDNKNNMNDDKNIKNSIEDSNG